MTLLQGQSKDWRLQTRDQGIDFSLVETVKFPSTPGATIKFRGGATMGYDHATRGGIRIVTVRNSEYSKGLSIEDSITVLKESRRGALYIDSERGAAYPVTSLWGGGQDFGAAITLTNAAANTGGLGMRGLQVSVNNEDTITSMHGLLCTVENDNGATISSNWYGARFVTKNNGVKSGGTHHTLEVSDESQGSFTGSSLVSLLYLEKHSNSYGDNHDAAIYMINNANTTYAKDITYAIYLKSGASGSDFTNVFGFDSNDGTEGFTAVSGASAQGNIDGYIRIYDVATGQALYILCRDAVPS